MEKTKFLLSDKCRKAIATALAGITLLSSISVPVIAEEETTTVDPNSDASNQTQGTENQAEENEETVTVAKDKVFKVVYGLGEGTVYVNHDGETETLEATEEQQVYTLECASNETVTITAVSAEGGTVYNLDEVDDSGQQLIQAYANGTNEASADIITDTNKLMFVSFSDVSEAYDETLNEIATLALTSGTKAEQMADIANSMVGAPYVHGGHTPAGFDCSGLVSYAAGQAGVDLSGNTFTMWQTLMDSGTPYTDIDLNVSYDTQAKKGDIIIFCRSFDPSGVIDVPHVAIMLDGDNMVGAIYTGVKNDLPVSMWKDYGGFTDKASEQARVFHFSAEKDAKVSVVKNSANKPVTDGNPNYSLAGAVYKVCTGADCSNATKVGTITTDIHGNGSTGTMKLDASVNTLYAQEVSPSKGYCLDPQIYTITLDSSGNGSFTSTEPIGNDPLTITLNKVSANGDIIPAGEEPKSLEGAEFTVKYYAVDTTTVNSSDDVANVTPTKTWVLKTIKNANGQYRVYLDDAHKVKGDSFYTETLVTGNKRTYLPLGVVTVEETKAPEGYTLENKITIESTGDQVTTAPNGIALFKVDGSNGNYQVQGGNYFTATDKPIYGALKITKKDSQLGAEAQGDAPNLSATFEVVNNDDKATKTLIAPDGTRYTAGPHEAFEYKIHTDEAGNFQSPAEFLEYGKYTVSEIEAPVGYEGTTTTRTINIENEGDSFEIEYTNEAKRGTFSLQKINAETGKRANGGTDLQISFEVYNRSTHNVVVNGHTYAPGEVCYTNTTNKDGFWQGPEKLLPYGTYEVKETVWHEGMLTVKDSDVITIRETNENVPVELVNKDDGYSTLVHKVTDYKSSGSSYSKPEAGAVYGIVLTSEVTKYGSVSAALAHQYDTDIKNLTDRDWLNANIFTDGKLTSDNINKDGADLTKMSAREYALMKTNDEGNASVDYLVYGSYTMVQLCSPNDEISVEKSTVKFDLNKEHREYKFEASNVAEKYYIRLVKKDLVTNKNIDLNSATFKVYQMVDGEKKYVTQKVGSKTYDKFRATSQNGSGEAGVFYAADDDGGTVTLPLQVIAGEYWIEEVGVPDGFTKSDDIKVTIKKGNITSVDDEDNQYISTTVTNKPITGTLSIQKEIENDDFDKTLIDENTITQIEFSLIANEDIINPDDGTVLTAKGEVAKDLKGNKIGVMHLNANGQATLRSIPLGKYTLVETYIPSSLQTNVEKHDVVITADKPVTDTYSIVNKPTEVAISKKAVTGDAELEGATLQVIDSNNNVIDEWVSTSEQHIITGLTRNATYTLRETITPENGTYVKANDVKFTVKEDGTTDTVKMIDKLVDVSKVDVAGEEVEGAKMQVTDRAGNVIDEWTSTGETHYVKNLVVGGTYVIHEEVASEGYVVANDIEFTVTDDAKNQHYDVVDKRVKVSKQDVGGAEIEGAVLTVKDAEGNVMDTWTSGDKPHYVNGLHVGKTYTLTEDTTPLGYVTATEIEFTVDEDGVDQTYTMVDTRVNVSKVDVNGEEVEGNKLSVLDTDGNVIDSWTSTTETHYVNNLIAGKEYILHEDVAAEGYAYAQDIKFTAGETEDVSLKMVDKRVSVSKVDMSGEEVEGAQMTVTDKDGNVVDQWTSTTEPHYISNIKVGETYTLNEVVAPEGYVKATSVEFTVTEDDVDQSLTMVDKRVEVSKVDCGGEEVFGAVLTIKDENGTVVDTWTSGNETHYVTGLEAGKTYTLTEDTTPAGYVTATEITFTVTDDGIDQKVTMVDTIERVAKVDENGDYVIGAQMKAFDENGNLIDLWTTGRHLIDFTDEQKEALKNGETVEFTLPSRAKVKAYAVTENGETRYEAMVQARGLAYYDIDIDGNETTHRVYGLKQGQKYTVKEVVTPDGYYTADDAVLAPTPTEDHLTNMVDNQINYKFAKVNEDGEAIVGVRLSLTDITDEENPVEIDLPNGGITGEEPLELSNTLIGGHKYRLTEEESVDGYAKSQSMEFVVDTKGSAEWTIITMVDLSNEVYIQKIDNHGNPVVGAKMQLFEVTDVQTEATKDDSMLDDDAFNVESETDEAVGLDDETDTPVADVTENEATKDADMIEDNEFDVEADPNEDPAKYVTVGDTIYTLGNMVYEWTTTETPEDISKVVTGDKMYMVREVEAPFGYEKIDDTPFKVVGTTNTVQVIVATDRISSLNVQVIKTDNKDKTVFLKGAEFKLFDKDNKVVTGYDGQPCVGTTDAEGKLSFNAEWREGMYVMETKAPEGYKLNTSKFAITPDENTFDFTEAYVVTVEDEKVPQTGVAGVTGLIGAFGMAGVSAIGILKKKKKEEEKN